MEILLGNSDGKYDLNQRLNQKSTNSHQPYQGLSKLLIQPNSFRSEPFENLQICFKQDCDNPADCPFSNQCNLPPYSCEVTIDNETLDFTNFTINGTIY